MRELFEQLPRTSLDRAASLPFLDTCFVLEMARRGQLNRLHSAGVGMTSFNIAELAHVERHQPQHVRHTLKEFLKGHPELVVVDVPVVPGDRGAEHAFVEDVEPDLLLKIRDPSDAVLIAAAMRTKSDVYTKDKHHLFTTVLENYLQAYGIHVWKEWKDHTSI